jgi:hypothetical protein
MKATVIRAKIDALEDLISKAYAIEIAGVVGGVVDVSEIKNELKRLSRKLQEIENEND